MAKKKASKKKVKKVQEAITIKINADGSRTRTHIGKDPKD